MGLFYDWGLLIIEPEVVAQAASKQYSATAVA